MRSKSCADVKSEGAFLGWLRCLRRPSLSMCLLLCSSPVWGAELDAPLIAAVQRNQLQQVERFLGFGGEIPLIDSFGYSLLEHAAAKGHAEMVHLLARSGADPAYVDSHGNTALHVACREGHEAAALAIISLLGTHLSQTIKHTNEKGKTPLQLLVESPSGCPTLVQSLLALGAPVNVRNLEDQSTPLWWAAKAGRSDVMKSLLLAQSNPEVGNQHGVTPLMVACYEGHTEAVQLLLTLGRADPNHTTPLVVTPLMVASYQGRRSIVDLLLSHNAHVQRTSDPTLGGGKAFHYAVKRGHFEIAQILQDAERKVSIEQTEVQSLREELKRIQAQHEHLWGIHQSQLKDAASRYYLRDEPSLRAFYETFSRKAIEFFLAYKVLDTGLVERTRDGGIYTAASGVELLGELIPLPGGGLIAKGISAVMNYIADKKEEAIIQALASFTVFLNELDASIELAARNMTYCYEAQIRKLTEAGAGRLAEAALRRFMEYARDGGVKSGEPLWEQLREAIVYYEERVFLFKTLYTFEAKELKLESTPKWTDEGLFRETGVQLETGERYINPKHRQHETYGFRLGRKTDCARLGYESLDLHPELSNLRDTSSPKPSSGLPKKRADKSLVEGDAACCCAMA